MYEKSDGRCNRRIKGNDLNKSLKGWEVKEIIGGGRVHEIKEKETLHFKKTN